MAQISRPFQVALAAAGLLVVVWFVALRGHSSSSESTVSSASTPASTASSNSSPGSPSSAYHGSAPGVEGLTKDIQKAHGAVAQSEHNAAQLEQKSAQASGESSTTRTHTSASSPAGKAPAPSKSAGSSAAKHASSGTSGQAWVEHQLSRKMTVALLFYSAHSYDDSRTRRELQKLIGGERSRHEKIALRVATPDQVGTYGSFTRVSSVYQTPTLLLVTPKGEVKPPITGLTDAFSIEQAIDEKTQP